MVSRKITHWPLALTFWASFALAVSAADGPAPPPPEAWRTVDPQNLVLIDTKYGQVAVEIAPEFAPNHAARLRALIRAHFYDGLSFYRVIDGFVAQGGIGEGTASTKDHPLEAKGLTRWPPLKAEFDRASAPAPAFTPLGNADPMAPEVGFEDGFPVARDPAAGREWLIHCPGTFAFARDNDPDTAATEFYIVIGQSPRRLDRDLTAFGRVLSGMQYLQKLERGDPDVDSGVIADASKRDPIIRMHLASDEPVTERETFQVLRTESKSFADALEARRHPTSPFYFRKPPPVLDICGVPVQVRRVSGP
ncbi:MAG TPA: peptidylprolyl isomerase [Rhizomicrobium sp.]|nr:peptidylprolyl isomerase [Rhizomicrobium sp.]